VGGRCEGLRRRHRRRRDTDQAARVVAAGGRLFGRGGRQQPRGSLGPRGASRRWRRWSRLSLTPAASGRPLPCRAAALMAGRSSNPDGLLRADAVHASPLADRLDGCRLLAWRLAPDVAARRGTCDCGDGGHADAPAPRWWIHSCGARPHHPRRTGVSTCPWRVCRRASAGVRAGGDRCRGWPPPAPPLFCLLLAAAAPAVAATDERRVRPVLPSRLWLRRRRRRRRWDTFRSPGSDRLPAISF